jgi:hypothetical protein
VVVAVNKNFEYGARSVRDSAMFSGTLTRQDGGEGGSMDGFTAFPENIGGALERWLRQGIVDIP